MAKSAPAERPKTLEFKWTTSRARDTYGYNVCTLYVDGEKAARCNGGGYDMKGTALGDWVAASYADRLRHLTLNQCKGLYGLTFHDPNYKPGQAKVESETMRP